MTEVNRRHQRDGLWEPSSERKWSGFGRAGGSHLSCLVAGFQDLAMAFGLQLVGFML